MNNDDPFDAYEQLPPPRRDTERTDTHLLDLGVLCVALVLLGIVWMEVLT